MKYCIEVPSNIEEIEHILTEVKKVGYKWIAIDWDAKFTLEKFRDNHHKMVFDIASKKISRISSEENTYPQVTVKELFQYMGITTDRFMEKSNRISIKELREILCK